MNRIIDPTFFGQFRWKTRMTDISAVRVVPQDNPNDQCAGFKSCLSAVPEAFQNISNGPL
jgi:hypothetical protein